MKTFNLLQDVDLAPKMFAKGKLEIIPHRIKGRQAIARIFEKAMKEAHND